MWKEAVRRKRMDGNRSSREGGCQRERGRMPAQEGGCQHERGRMPAREREDAGRSLREGGYRPFIDRGRSPFVERGRRPLCVVVGGKNNEFPPCWEIQSLTMSEFQIQWT